METEAIWLGTEAVWGWARLAHHPIIFGKSSFSKFKDLICERTEEVAHGKWWPRRASTASLGTVGTWLAHGYRGGLGSPRLVPIVVFTGLGP